MDEKRFSVLIFEDNPDTGLGIFRRIAGACLEARVIWYKSIGPSVDERGCEPKNMSEEDINNDLSLDDVFSCDIAIFDMDIPISPAWNSPLEISGYGGMNFVLQNKERFSVNTNVYIFTAYDIETTEIDELTSDTWGASTGPYFTKWIKSEGEREDADFDSLLRDEIIPLYECYQRGVLPLEFRKVRFASQHDLPVLIVGETGTGKELIANWIHKLWWEKKYKDKAPPLVTINCAGLSRELARDELFGHVKYAFTDAREHKVGVCLRAAGISGFTYKPTSNKTDVEEVKKIENLASQLFSGDYLNNTTAEQVLTDFRTFIHEVFEENKLFKLTEKLARGLAERAGADSMEDYRKSLKNISKDRITLHPNSLDIFFTKNLASESPPKAKEPMEQECLGTLFLDEFGDLPEEVQTFLLRYLNSYEVQPLGYEGMIHGAKVRIIAATSDPKVARLAGFDEKEFSSQPRQKDFREDLFYRVGHQIIRVKPLDASEARYLIQRWFEGSNSELWESDAIEYIANEISKTDEKGFRRSSGHRRELRRIVELAQAWTATAEDRGIRRPRITEELIKSLWHPALVSEAISEAPFIREEVPDTSPGDIQPRWERGAKILTVGSKEIPLGPQEAAAFDLLWEHKPEWVPVEQILKAYQASEDAGSDQGVAKPGLDKDVDSKMRSKINNFVFKMNAKLDTTTLHIRRKTEKGKHGKTTHLRLEDGSVLSLPIG